MCLSIVIVDSKATSMRLEDCDRNFFARFECSNLKPITTLFADNRVLLFVR
jgi:hypothetical protein